MPTVLMLHGGIIRENITQLLGIMILILIIMKMMIKKG